MGLWWGKVGFWLTAVCLFAIFVIWIIRRWLIVRVPEQSVGVVYNVEAQAFARFLPPGTHWLRPFVEQVKVIVPITTSNVQGESEGVQAIGGIPLSISWSLAYDLDPFRVSPANAPGLARMMPRKTAVVARRHLNNCLQHVIGDYTITQLCQPGVHKRLEREVRQLAAERLTSLGFSVSRVMIGQIVMPRHVQTALEAAQERQMQAENEARVLAQLQGVISQFSETDMQRLMELERIQKMGQNGVTYFYTANREPEPMPRSRLSRPTTIDQTVMMPGLS